MLRHRLLAVCAYGPVLREAIQEPMRRTGKMLGEEDRERERGRVEEVWRRTISYMISGVEGRSLGSEI